MEDSVRIFTAEEIAIFEDLADPISDVNLDRTGARNDMCGIGDICASHEALRQSARAAAPVCNCPATYRAIKPETHIDTCPVVDDALPVDDGLVAALEAAAHYPVSTYGKAVVLLEDAKRILRARQPGKVDE